ncbi:MAG TPA: cyclic nucleotide-binding domain-containing protein [Burkholderiales bacterium]|nr:cyclic nucleotide-binding domain-containing protein [Burkholderiales bacterium]
MAETSEDAIPFWTLPPQHLKALGEQGTVRSYPKNAVIINEGERSDSLYIVLSGKVKVYLADETGKELLLSTQGPGEYFGEMILDEGPRSASVMTLEPSRFAVVSVAQFRQFLSQNPDIGLELIKSLIYRMRALTKTVGNLGLLDVYGRVARLLIDMAVEENGKQVIKEHLTQQDMASRVGCSREMISRILKDLRVGGYIKMEGERMIIAKKPPAAW